MHEEEVKVQGEPEVTQGLAETAVVDAPEPEPSGPEEGEKEDGAAVDPALAEPDEPEPGTPDLGNPVGRAKVIAGNVLDPGIGMQVGLENTRNPIRVATRTMEGAMLGKEALVEAIARVCHEANRAYCLALGDPGAPAWEFAPEWMRESVRAGVRLHQENAEVLPAQSHESWMAKKAADGWTWGSLRDDTAKQHPCMLPWAKLPRHQQFKDVLFMSINDAFKVL